MAQILNLIQSIPNSPESLLDLITNLLLTHGYLVVLVGAALDNFGLPASGDVVLFAGGWISNQGKLSLPAVMLSGASGALISDNAVYWIGRIGGRPLVNRVSKVRVLRFLISQKNLAKVESYFDAHGGKTVFLGRFGPGLRSMTPLFSGVTRMSYPRFLPYNLSAVVLWAVGYTLVGYIFGQYWSALLTVAKSAGYGFVVLAILIIGLYAYRHRNKRQG